MQDKYCFIVPQNLEAATCILLFKWLTGKNNVCTVVSTENNLISDLKRLDLNNFKFVYVVGFYNLQELPPFLDDKKIIYINKKLFHSKITFSRIISGDKTTVELFYEFIAKYTDKNLTANQLFLYNSVVKYFNYSFDTDLFPLKLFYFFKTQKTSNKIESFVNRFENGLVLFNDSENSTLNIILRDLSNTLKSLKVYKGEFLYNNTKFSVISCFGTKYINEISYRLLKQYNFDFSLVINTEKNAAHFRKNKKCHTDLSKLVKELFDGFGTEHAAFCTLNERLINITKSFFPVC